MSRTTCKTTKISRHVVRQERKQIVLLRLFLVFYILLSSISGLYSVLLLALQVIVYIVTHQLLPKGVLVLLLIAMSSTINVISSLAIWKWKQWGVYGFVSSVLISFLALGINKGIDLIDIVVSFAILLLFTWLIIPIWCYLK